ACVPRRRDCRGGTQDLTARDEEGRRARVRAARDRDGFPRGARASSTKADRLRHVRTRLNEIVPARSQQARDRGGSVLRRVNGLTGASEPCSTKVGVFNPDSFLLLVYTERSPMKRRIPVLACITTFALLSSAWAQKPIIYPAKKQ